MIVLELGAAGAAAVGAAACCAGPSLWRARALAVAMVLACLPFVPTAAGVAVLAGSALALGAGLRRRPAALRTADLHRVVGAVLMAGMLVFGGHAGSAMRAAGHAGHSTAELPSPATAVAIAVAGYLVWSIVLLMRPGHDRTLVMRIEAAGMTAMFAIMLGGMAASA